MTANLSALKLFCDNRELHVQMSPYLKHAHNLEREIKTLFKLVHDYYATYEDEDSIESENLKVFYDKQYPAARDRDVVIDTIAQVYALKVQDDLARDVLENLIEEQYATRLIQKLMPVMSGESHGVVAGLSEEIEGFTMLMKNPPEQTQILTPVEMSVEELVTEVFEQQGYQWHLPTLNQALNGVKEGQLGLVYAYVNAGKTSFMTAAVAAFAESMTEEDDCLVYAGNEEPGKMVLPRIISALTGISDYDTKMNATRTQQMLDESAYHRIKLFDSITHISQIKALLETHQPKVLVIDQGSYVDPGKNFSGNEISKHEFLYQTYRKLAKLHNCGIVCASQGVGETENKKWLKMSDVYGSRVAIQGALDFCIGIGFQDDGAHADLRFINISKDKAGAGDRFVTNFDRYTNTWMEV